MATVFASIATPGPAGPTGPTGPIGPQGAASTVPGPTGPVSTVPGPIGPVGISYLPRGAYAAGTTYAQGDEVADSNVNYLSLQGGNIGHTPASSPTYWQSLAGGGMLDPGANGIVKRTAVNVTAPATGTDLPVFMASGGSHAGGAVPDPGATAGNVKFLREDATFALPGPWTINGSDLSYTAGKVAIGNSAPAHTLHVSAQTTAGDVTTARQIAIGVDSNDLYSLTLGYYSTGAALCGVIQSRQGGNAGPLLINPSGGNVGIGTQAPSRALTVYTDALTAISQFRFGFSDVVFWEIGRDNAVTGRLRFVDQGGEKLTILNNGNVGIGTATPTSPLQVVGVPVYVNNAAAVAGGLTAGATYRTGANPDPLCIVH